MASRRAQRVFGASAFVACAVTAGAAYAGDASEDACMTAEVDGQKQQRKGLLLASRAAFTACSQLACPTEVVEYCTKWLRDVNAAIPSVVVVGRDADGRDVTEARVLIDGNAVAGALDGSAIELDPGAHTFRFDRDGRAPVTQAIVVRERDKGRRLVVRFDAPAPTSTQAPVPVATYVFGGIALAGLGVFAVEGARGVGERSDAGCANGCVAADFGKVRDAYVVADIGLGVAVVSSAVAAWLFLSRGRVAASPRAPVTGRADFAARSGEEIVHGSREADIGPTHVVRSVPPPASAAADDGKSVAFEMAQDWYVAAGKVDLPKR